MLLKLIKLMVDVKWIESSANEVMAFLNTSEKGLSEEEAKERIKKYGYNEITKKKKKGVVEIFLEQFKSPLIYLLLLAAVISFISGELIDTYVILAILLVNSVIGTYHELNAINSIKSLERMVEGKAKVIRDGKLKVIPAREVVPGDIVIFEEGDKIIADSRIIEENGLIVNESTLTGESIGVEKTSEKVSAKKVAEMKNILFTSTFVIRGEAKAVVISTGNKTLIGKLYEKIEEEQRFPIREKLEEMTKSLAKVVISAMIILGVISIFIGYEWEYVFELLLAQSVSFIPAGLPIVITVAMAISAFSMAKKNAIVKKLEAMEAMGRIDYLCIDKTGTVTLNEIRLSKVVVDGKEYDIGEDVKLNGKVIVPVEEKELIKAFEISSLCNKAKKTENEYVGDPLEVSIFKAAEKIGIEKSIEVLKKTNEIVYEIPFDASKKFMMILLKDKNKKTYLKALKGAPEKVLEISSYVYEKGEIKKIAKKERERILKEVERFASKGYRTLAIAFSEKGGKDIKDLVFFGLLCFEDPVREEAKQAIEDLEKAGIRVMMITGDHKLTAKAVAKNIGLKGEVVNEDELFNRNPEEVEKNIEKIAVVSRASVEGKMKIINILKKKNYRVAMTGDGVNDTLALKKADVGISLASGTDVAKEASDIILTDDNIESIVNAIHEGRRSIINIKKTIRYLFSTNASEVAFLVSFLFSPLIGLSLKYPLTATQILYVNLVTDGLTDVAIATEKKEKELKRHKPSYFRRDYFSKEVKNFIAVSSFVSLVFLFIVFFIYEGSEKVGTVVFTTLAFMQLFTALSARKIYPVNDLPNKYLIIAIFVSIMIQLLVIYVEPLSSIMKVVPLNINDWVVVISASCVLFFSQEMAKKLRITLK